MAKGGNLLQRRQGASKGATEDMGVDRALAGPPAALVEGAALVGRRYGVDIDGTTVRVVEVIEQTVASFATYQGNSTAESFQQFLETKPQGPVTVVWSDADFHLRRIPLPNLPSAALRAGMLDAVEDSLPMAPGSAMVAARVVASRLDGSFHATVAAADRTEVGSMWQMVSMPGVHLVPAPLLFSDDGLYLGLRDGGAQLLLAVGGAAVAARTLSAGGLSAVRDALTDGEQSAEERLTTISRGGTRLDPTAAAAVDRYSQAISDEVRRTADFWSRQGLAVPAEIFVHGQGIALPNLAGKLLDAAFLAKAAPMPAVSLDAVARADLPRAYLSLLAAQFNPSVQILAGLPDPLAAERVRRRSERGRSGRTIVLAGLAAAALIAALVAPVVLAKRDLSHARSAQDKVDAELAGLRKVIKLNDQVRSGQRAFAAAVADDVKWDVLFAQTIESAPKDVPIRFSSVQVDRKNKNVNMTFTATIDSPTLDPVSAWLATLQQLGAKNPWVTSATLNGSSVAGGKDQVKATFTAPRLVDETIAAKRDGTSEDASK